MDKELEINLDEIKFEQLARKRLNDYEIAIQMFSSTSLPDRFLNDEERRFCELIASRVRRKYTFGGTDSTELLDAPGIITVEQAMQLASEENQRLYNIGIDEINNRATRKVERENTRLDRVTKQYAERVARINTDAGKRGMLNSTIVIDQLNKAEESKTNAIQAIESEIDYVEAQKALEIERFTTGHDGRVKALANRIHSESVRQNLAAAREISLQRDRAYKNWITFERHVAGMPINISKQIDDEIREEYFAFLAKQESGRAFRLIDCDPVFFYNLTQSSWDKLYVEFEKRTVHIS